MVVHDLKGELYALSARYRKEKLNNLVFRFEATCNDGTSACFNPLDEVRLRTDHEVADAQNIATLIVDPDGKGFSGENAHWSRTARSFLVGVILHVLYSENDKTMYGLDAFLSNPNMTQMEIFERMLKAEHDPTLERGWINGDGDQTATMNEVAKAARDMIERPEGERGSVMSSVKSYLDIYRDPIIAKNTCRSDFSIQDLMQNDRPVTLYIVNSPSDMDRSMPLTRLLINFVMRGFTRKVEYHKTTLRPIKSYKHALLIMMDELPALGNLSIMAGSIPYVAGYGIRIMAVIQDFAQLRERYGDDGARGIMANMHIKIMYAPGDPATARQFSEMLGDMTIRYHSPSVGVNGKKSWNEHLEKRPMLTPSEFMTLQDHHEIVHIANNPVIACGRITYYEEPYFQEKMMPQLDVCDQLPRREQSGVQQSAKLEKQAAEQAQIRIAKANEIKRLRGEPVEPRITPIDVLPTAPIAPTLPIGANPGFTPPPSQPLAPSTPPPARPAGSLADQFDAGKQLGLDDDLE